MENILPKKIFFQTDFSEENVLHSSEKQKSYLIITESGKHLKVSPTSYFLLKSFEDGLPVQKISDILKTSEEKVTSSYERLIAKIDKIDKDETNRLTGFWFLWELIPARLVNHAARPLAIMFHPAAAGLSILLILIGIILNVKSGLFSTFTAVQDPQAFWFGYFLFFISVVFHEFGHASASFRYGAAAKGIGFSIYLIFPVLYSDVTNAWRLKSWQRAVVGLGGIYFHLLFAFIYTLLGIYLNDVSFKLATLMIFAVCILNLNPIFRFDGYWIFADLLGVINLSQQPKEVFVYFYKRLRGLPYDGLPWKTWVSFIVTIYSVVSVIMIAFFLYIYFSRIWDTISQYPAEAQKFFSIIWAGGSVNFSEIHTFFLLTVSKVILFYVFYNIVIKPIKNRFLRAKTTK
jgi:putative peptide zinc metalloprotease protein